MSWKALVSPRRNTQSAAGMCLQFAQSFFGAPVAHRSAWHAWLATQHKHGPNVPLPNVPVLLWFSHWGEYHDGQGQYGDDPKRPYYGNWGHVTPIIPGDAIYSSPWHVWYGQERYWTIAEIERTFNAKYVGWSEDINRLRVAEPEEEDDMFSDADRKLLKQTAERVGRVEKKSNASYDALFTRKRMRCCGHLGQWTLLN